MAYHFTGAGRSSGRHDPGGLTLFWHGYLSVDLFFILSGFVLALTYSGMFEGARNGSAPHNSRPMLTFIGHRLARIYPLYVAVLFLAVAIHVTGLERSDPPPAYVLTLVANIAMVQAWGLAQSITWPSWSISAEWAAYLAFPLLLAACAGRRRWPSVVAFLLAASVLLLLAYTGLLGEPLAERVGPLDIWHYTSLAPVLRCLSEFSLGLLTFRIHRSASVARTRLFRIVCPIVAGLMIATSLWHGTDLLWVALVPVLILGLASDRGVVANLLASRPLHQVGVLSYAIYLLHFRFVRLALGGDALLSGRGVPFAQGIAVVGCGVIVVLAAVLAHRAIERPGRRWLRLVVDRLVARAATAADPRRMAAKPLRGALRQP